MSANQPTAKHIGIAIIVVVLLWIIAWAALMMFLPNYETRGQFGDMFGAVNSLFSGLAMAGVIYTVWLQTKEIEAQREDRKGSEEAQQQQVALLSKQLATFEERLRLDKLLYQSQIAPVFAFDGGSSNPNREQMNFINRGGRFRFSNISVGGGVVAEFTPKTWIATETHFSIILRKEPALPDGNLLFEIYYETADRSVESKSFECTRGGTVVEKQTG